jgi:hypothetical protein
MNKKAFIFDLDGESLTTARYNFLCENCKKILISQETATRRPNAFDYS